jgi:hypothetical protein
VSVIGLPTIKAYLRVTHTSDDALLQTLLDAAEAEAMRYMNRSELPGAPYDRDTLRKAAEVKLTPYRTEMGC